MAKGSNKQRSGAGLPEGLVTATPQGCRLRVKVVPRASRQQVAGIVGNALKVTVTAAPERGEANGQLVAFLAELMHLPKNHVVLLSGLLSREKVVELRGASPAQVTAILQEVLA